MEPQDQRRLLTPGQSRQRVEEFVVLSEGRFGGRQRSPIDDRLMSMDVPTRIHHHRSEIRLWVEHPRASRLQPDECVLHDLLRRGPRARQQVSNLEER